MIYDDYLELKGEDIVYFVDQEESAKDVYRLVYFFNDCEDAYLTMWIQSERDGFYLYIMVVHNELFGISLESLDPNYKVWLMEKGRRASQSSYYSAGIKASIFAKDIVKTLCPKLDVDWSYSETYYKRMSEKPLGGRETVCCTEKTYAFDESRCDICA